jgi:hypothetical protein
MSYVYRRPFDYAQRQRRSFIRAGQTITVITGGQWVAGQTYVPGFKQGHTYTPGFQEGEFYKPGFQQGQVIS